MYSELIRVALGVCNFGLAFLRQFNRCVRAYTSSIRSSRVKNINLSLRRANSRLKNNSRLKKRSSIDQRHDPRVHRLDLERASPRTIEGVCLFGCRDEAAQETCSSRWTVNNATSTSCQRRSAERERKLLEPCYLSKSFARASSHAQCNVSITSRVYSTYLINWKSSLISLVIFAGTHSYICTIRASERINYCIHASLPLCFCLCYTRARVCAVLYVPSRAEESAKREQLIIDPRAAALAACAPSHKHSRHLCRCRAELAIASFIIHSA
ncbi:unnamed protein product [Trichogramma brassicae]|uniref:Uncharacterized protein n=1 Tax=Trichogramma brassicae TaxID=86971 RepID=A0A6H5IG82_9HYME|nr:unnamed protein product [Trichogramma brassicae]